MVTRIALPATSTTLFGPLNKCNPIVEPRIASFHEDTAIRGLKETIILQAKPQRRNIAMADFAAWFRREDYERFREIMEEAIGFRRASMSGSCSRRASGEGG